MGKQRKERSNTCASRNKDRIQFVVWPGKQVTVREFEPYFGANLKLLFHLLCKLTFNSIGNFNGFVIWVALHRKASGFRPLAGAIVIGVEREVEKLAWFKFICPIQRFEFNGIKILQRIDYGDDF